MAFHDIIVIDMLTLGSTSTNLVCTTLLVQNFLVSENEKELLEGNHRHAIGRPLIVCTREVDVDVIFFRRFSKVCNITIGCWVWVYINAFSKRLLF